MKIRFKIDQKEAIRAGRNVPGRDVILDVDPANLPHDERELLASLLDTEVEPARCSRPAKVDGLHVGSVRLVRPDEQGVHDELERLTGVIARERAERAAKLEAERASYRTMIQALENGTYFEADRVPLKERNLGVEWHLAPNYSKNDEEAQNLWARVEKLRQKERERIVRTVDEALAPDDEETRHALMREVSSGEYERYCPNAARYDRERAQAARQAAEAEEERRREAVRGLLREHGSPDQLERYDAGVLPEKELSRLIKDALFAPFDKFARYAKLTDDDIQHSEDCWDFGNPALSFHSEAAKELSWVAWDTLKTIRTAAPEDATVEPRRHEGSCPYCDAMAERNSIRVERQFAGETYRRLYALD